MSNRQAAEALKGQKFPVLDDGHVIFLDHMGSDEDIVQAARTSYQTGTKHTSDNGTLLRYLMRHRHSSPFESATIKLHVKLPIVVERQWCLAGRTELHFDRGVDNSGKDKGLYRRKSTVEDLYRCWNSPGRWKVKQRFLRKVNANGDVAWTHIKDIWKTGVKAVYQVTARVDSFDEFVVWVTADHPFMTEHGWRTLEEFCSLPTEANSEWSSAAKVGVVGRMDGRLEKKRIAQEFNQIDEATEVWVPLKGWGDFYEISSQGRVRGVALKKKHSGRMKKPVIRTDNGYKRPVVTLFRPNGKPQQKVIARAMMESFYDEVPPNSTLVRHRDGNSFNNVLGNLAWGSNAENTADSVMHGTHSAPSRRFMFTEVVDIKHCGMEETYDIEVDDEDHNFVAGGFVVHNCRHRTAGWNEVSGRYSALPDECYLPKIEDVCLQSDTNRQGSGNAIDNEHAKSFLKRQKEIQELAHKYYQEDLQNGVARETARNSLPLSTYTEKVWWINLHNLLHFLALRMDHHAQKEIRDYANTIGREIVAKLFPETWEAFLDYRLFAMQLSSTDISVISTVMQNHYDEGQPSKTQWLSEMPDRWRSPRCRERDEFFQKITRLGLYVEAK